MSKILVDTSVIIDFLRRKDKEQTLFYSLSEEDLYISIVTHTELYAGKSVWENKKKKEALEDVLSGVTILPLNEVVSQKAGCFKTKYLTTSLLDCIIAATAEKDDFTLVTINIKDFENIEEIKLYPLKG